MNLSGPGQQEVMFHTHSHTRLAHMEVHEQKFPITQYFNIQAPSIYCHKLQ